MSRQGPVGGSAAVLSDLRAAVHDLQQRVAALEHTAEPAAAEPMDVSPQAAVHSGFSPPTTGPGLGFGLVGRAVLLFAGAFLLRSLTEGGVIPPAAGFGLGLCYGIAMVVLAGRSGRRGDRATATATGLAAILIAYPFVYETTALRNHVSPAAGAAALALLSAAGLTVAVRGGLRVLYWAFGLAVLATLTALHFATGAAVLFTSLLLVLGSATVLVSYLRGWCLLRWPVALTADAVVLHLTVTATNPQGSLIAGQPVPAGAIQILAAALVVSYLGIFTYRAFVQGRGVRTFDVVQSALVIAVGYGAGSRLAEHLDRGQTLLGWAAIVAALAGYGIAFTVVRQRHGRGRAFFYFATLALLFLVLGSRTVIPGYLLAGTWIGLGVCTAWLGGRFRRSTLRSHSAVYLLLAFVQTGLLAAAGDAFLADPSGPWAATGVSGSMAFLSAAGCYVLLLRSRNPAAPRSRRIPRFLVGVLALVGLGWLVISVLTRLATGLPPDASPAVVAVIRTGVMAATAIGLAWAGRRAAYAELAWLVYPILVAGLAKLLFEDLNVRQPVALTISFAMFGASLIIAPRLLKRREPKETPDGDGD